MRFPARRARGALAGALAAAAAVIVVAAAACGRTPPARQLPALSELERAEVAAFRAGAALHPAAPAYCLGLTGPAPTRDPLAVAQGGPLRPPAPGVLREVAAALAPAEARGLFTCRDGGGRGPFPPGMVWLEVRWVEVGPAPAPVAAGVWVNGGGKWYSYTCALRRPPPQPAAQAEPWDPGPCTRDLTFID